MTDYPPVRLGRSAPHDGGDGRRRRPAQQLLPRATRHEHHLRRALGVGLARSACRTRSCGVCCQRSCASSPISALDLGVLPVALAAAVSPHWSMVVWTLGLFTVTESSLGQVIEPYGLRPFDGALAISSGHRGDLLGLVVGADRPDPVDPVDVCLVVLGRHVDRLGFLDVLLGDRPALTPIENFYQRLLADDPDEALRAGRTLLKERSLSAYYDEVALKGLQLAANDVQRGVLSSENLERMSTVSVAR